MFPFYFYAKDAKKVVQVFGGIRLWFKKAMVRINIFGLIILALGAIVGNAMGRVYLGGSAIAIGAVAGITIIAADILLRTRARQTAGKHRWLAPESGGSISIIPAWGIGIFLIGYALALRFGVKI